MMMFQRRNTTFLLLAAAVCLTSHTTRAFTVPLVGKSTTRSTTTLFATVDTEAVALSPKESVLSTARSCQDAYGLFVVDKTAKRDLTEAVEALEMTYDSSTAAPASVGTWDLVCTTSTSTQGIDTQQLFPQPLKDLTDRVATAANKYVTVQQILKSSSSDTTNTIDRIDHVIAYAPPQSLTEFLENLPEPLVNLKVNPLDVSKSQLILVHKAETTTDTTTTSLTLQSVIWNVAGNSTYLDPAGKDITSINLPSFATDFLASGTFTTTYQDEDVRIVRGKQGPLDFLRVFFKSTSTPSVMDVDDIPDAELVIDDIVAASESGGDDDVPSDVGSAGP